MNKNIIKRYLSETFVTEASKSEANGTPAVKLAGKIGKENKKANKDGVDAIGKDMKAYEKSLTKPDANEKTMGQNKFNYANEEEKTYHDEMEIMNGQEMIQYDRTDEKFRERALEAIEGSSNMGNNPEWANVVAKGQGGDPEFGKTLVKKIKSSIKKRDEQTPTTKMFGDDWEVTKEKGHKAYALENENKNKPQIKESMKRLKFKKEFKGVGNALKLIPESYRVDSKVFEMTDGNESYKVRWEGTLTEGKAVVLMASDKTMVNEDIQRMKQLMGYKSQDTLGTVKGKARIDEDKAFSDVWAKTKKIMESEDIEDQDAEKEAPFDEADIKQAPEAKKHVQGSVSTEKGTKAPAPKNGEWEKAKKGAAPEATKDVKKKA